MKPGVLGLVVCSVLALAFMAAPAMAQETVTISNFAFSPKALNIALGDTVTWTNQDSVAHTVTSDVGSELDSGAINTNLTYSHTFNTPGTYPYHCNFHDSMNGTVYVAGPSPPLPCTTCQGTKCSVEITNLDISGNNINYGIRNTGNASESISYILSVNGGSIDYAVVNMTNGSTNSYQKSYAFGTGRYEVRLDAHADCGANHSITVVRWIFDKYTCSNPSGTETQNRCDYPTGRYLTCLNGLWTAESQDAYCNNCPRHCGEGICSCGEGYLSCPADCPSSCVQGYTNSYTCDGNMLQRSYRYANCTTVWIAQTLCLNGCYNGACMNQTALQCGVQIMSFDYVSQVVSDSSTYVIVSSRNTGESTTRINTSLWVDGALRGFNYQNIAPGADFMTTLNYPSGSPGTHAITIKSKAGCGSEDSRVASITTISTVQQPAGPYQPPVQPVQKVTSVSFYPSFIDTMPFRSRIVGIGIATAKPQTFRIDVSGLPSDWAEYSSSLNVEDEKVSYVYITPQSLGNYTISITAKAESENLTFKADIPLFAAVPESALPEGVFGQLWSEFKQGMKYLLERPLFVVGILLLALIVVLLIGHRHLKKERWPIVG